MSMCGTTGADRGRYTSGEDAAALQLAGSGSVLSGSVSGRKVG
jgi:hypothetical protein